MADEGLWIFCFRGALGDPEGPGAQVGRVGLGHLWHLEKEREKQGWGLIKEPLAEMGFKQGRRGPSISRKAC